FPRRHRINGRTHLVGLVIPERRNSVIRAMRREIKHKNVVLVVLQRGDQRQKFTLARSVSMAKDDGGSAAKPGKEPALASSHRARHGKLHCVRSPGKA